MRRSSLLLAAAAATAFAAACSCGDAGTGQLRPKFVLDGAAVIADPKGDAHYAIDFGTVTVGSRFTPEVYVVNDGNATLTVKVDVAGIPAPFSLASGSFELRPKHRRALELSMLPTEENQFEALVTFVTNERDPAKKVRLMGRSARSQLVCNPTRLDLGYVVVGESRNGSFSCTNHLDVPTTITLGDFADIHRAFFSAEIVGHGKSAEVPAGGSIEVEVNFEAENIQGVASATLPLLDPSNQPVENIHITATVVDYALQVLYEDDTGARVPLTDCFQFPETDIEAEEIGHLWVRNVSSKPVSITELGIDQQADAFELIGPQIEEPIPVAPNGEEEIEVTLAFRPRTPHKYLGNLIIFGSGERAAPTKGLRACILGQGAGARISCVPSQINFGPVPLSMSLTRSYTCTNTAADREPKQVLYVMGITSSDPARFHAEIRGGVNENGYLPGESFVVDVTYTPQDVGIDQATITIENNSTATPEHETVVIGTGRDVPPCVFEITPSELRFGVVNPNGGKRTLTAYVVNQSTTHECYIYNPQLSEDSSPAFVLENEPVEFVMLPPRQPDPENPDISTQEHRYPITVSFAPTALGTFTGSVVFGISDPANPTQVIRLTGLGQKPCLKIEPEELNFGVVPPNCATTDLPITVTNVCSETITVNGVNFFHDAFPQFYEGWMPLFPLEVEPGDGFYFTILFRPDGTGFFEGHVELDGEYIDENGEAHPAVYPIRLLGEGRHDAIQTDSWTQADHSKVDVLWVIDNSGSMYEEQVLLSQQIPNFMSFAIEQKIDFHIGVTTTGVSYFPVNSTSCPTGFIGDEDGRLVPHPSLGRPRILTSKMPRQQLMEVFAQNVMVGTCHASEAVYEAARRALFERANEPYEQGGNKGFLRRDAALSIIGMTDEPDPDTRWMGNASEDRSVERYVKEFRSLKPRRGDDKRVKVHMISGGMTGCSIAEACPRCIEGVELTGGVWIDICTDPNDDAAWSDAFLRMSEGAFGFESAFRLTSEPADINGDGIVDHNDLEVRVGGRPQPARTSTGAIVWQYNPASQTLNFMPLYIPGPNQVIEVTYKVACRQ